MLAKGSGNSFLYGLFRPEIGVSLLRVVVPAECCQEIRIRWAIIKFGRERLPPLYDAHKSLIVSTSWLFLS